MRKVGLLVGRERSFPNAVIEAINKRNAGVEASYAKLDPARIDKAAPYDVLLDRISHDITCYQPLLKLAALNGTRVINNPFWRIADDKFFNTALAHRLGVKVPRTVLLPSKLYGDDVTAESLTNLNPVDWKGIVAELGFPMFIKPHWGGGWRDVSRVKDMDELMAAYNKSGRLTMLLQEEITFQQYVRCIVIGKEEVRPALWDPRQSHFDRYVKAPSSMPPLSPELEAQVLEQARKLCRALGYDMNTVEFAIKDGVPYAIDFMNSAPDLDISSIGEDHFKWAVEKMADLLIRVAQDPHRADKHHWSQFLQG